MVLRTAVFFLALVCASGFAGANAAPCPMPDKAAHTAHSGHGDCPDHTPQPDCDHTSYADCVDLQGAASSGKDTFETKNLAPSAASRPVFLKTGAPEPAAFCGRTVNPRPGPVFLLTKRLLI